MKIEKNLFFGFYWFFSILYFAGMEFYIYYQYDDMKNVAIVYQEVETIRVISYLLYFLIIGMLCIVYDKHVGD